MESLKHFMWEYQPYFQTIAEVRAKDFLAHFEFESDLRPQVCLVGVLEDERDDRLPICVEPQDSKYQDRLGDIPAIVRRLRRCDEDRLRHSHPTAAERYERGKQLEYLQQAIREAVATLSGDDCSVFSSLPTKVEGYLVSCVLRLDRSAYEKFPRLEKHVVARTPVATSFLDAVIDEYLRDCSVELSKPDPGINFGGFRDIEEVYRGAGARICDTAALAVGHIQGVCFRAFDRISSLKYERVSASGRIILAERGHPNVDPIVVLRDPIPVGNTRQARKLLETSGGGRSLLCDGVRIYGVGRTTGSYDPSREDLFEVDFLDHHAWELRHEGATLMRSIGGIPCQPKPPYRERKFRTDARRIFPEIEDESLDRLCRLVGAAARQKHGALLVVAPEAEREAERLAGQATRVEPFQVEEDVIDALTAIDGAVLISTSGVCHAIGVVLDGLASQLGDPARGSRYNSAIRYTESANGPRMAVVTSEDGTVDVVPDLKPQIPKAALDEALIELRAVADEPQPDIRRFNNVVSWLHRHRFYINADLCDEIKLLRSIVESRLTDVRCRIIYGEIAPDPGMDDSYLT